MKVIIPCAGDGTRWGDFQGVPKHLVELFGEPILHRTVRLINERVPDATISIVVKEDHPGYVISGTKRNWAKLDPQNYQSDKLLSSAHLWSKTQRTVVLFGDVFFTEDAMDKILEDPSPWSAYARFTASKYTGCDHAELFGFGFDTSEAQRIKDAALYAGELARKGKLKNWSGGWQIYKLAAGVAPEYLKGPEYKARTLSNHIEIDDWTEDIDSPEDWHRFCYAVADKEKNGAIQVSA